MIDVSACQDMIDVMTPDESLLTRQECLTG